MNHISEIIARHLLGKSSDEEKQMLDAWRKEGAENEAAFQRLMDTGFLESEWRKRKAVNWQRASEQMTERIGKTAKKVSLRSYLMRTAAAIALVVVGGAAAMYLFNKEPMPADKTVATVKPSLKAGEIRAVLNLSPDLSAEEGGIEVTSTEELKATLAQYKTNSKTNSQSPFPCGEGRGGVCLSVPRGGEFRIELEDGTEVWLNAQSRLVYPESFSDTERRVQVEGEAYFKVAKNDSKPFYVETHGQVVRVVGTEFNVHSYAEDKTVQTTLVSGKVAIAPSNRTKASSNTPTTSGGVGGGLILSPGHQAVFDKEAGSMKIKSVDTEVVTSWKDGMFVFEDMTLSDIMLTLSRWYDFDYEFRDTKAAQTVFMGRIPRYSDFSDVMEIIELSGGLKLSLTNRHLTIESIGK